MNEITTGVGRTGKWFGFQHYDLNPDMIAIGKGIGNGYPASVAVVSNKVSVLLKKPHSLLVLRNTVPATQKALLSP